MRPRAAAILLVAAVSLCLSSSASASTQTVYIRNISTVVSDATLRNALPAFQAQVSDDFAPVWSMDAQLVFLGSAQEPSGGWVLTVNNQSDVPGALGYHDVCHQDGHGTPCGYVSAETTLGAGDDPMVTLSHELLEMIADPYTQTFQKVGRRFYVQEVCDAPESDAYAYTRAGADGSPILLTDFVTPFWFRPGHIGPYDFKGYIKRPLQVLPGGYVSWWDESWHQKFQSSSGRGL